MPFKILYAASNRNGSKLQLHRFLEQMQFSDCVIKVAGYKKMGMNLDWTLDALRDIGNHKVVSINNDNFEIYLSQVKAFSPNLIISDLEVYSSYIGYILGIQVWQVSPLLLNVAQPPIREVYTNRNYKSMFNISDDKLLKNVIFNADKSFVYSHLCDVKKPPILLDKYEWIRPYFYLGSISKPCEHNVVSVIHSNIDKMLKILKDESDVIVFTDKDIHAVDEAKDICDDKEYACNLKNSLYFISQGSTDILADAFYNNKYPIIMPDMFDAESVMNAMFYEHYDLGYVSYDGIISRDIKDFNIVPDENVKYLHEKVFEVI